MDQSDISRRESLRLARFGVLLAAGLGVVESASAESPQKGAFDSTQIKGEPGGVLIKLFKVDADGSYELLKTTDVPGLKSTSIGVGGQLTLKYIKGGITLANLSDVIMKQ